MSEQKNKVILLQMKMSKKDNDTKGKIWRKKKDFK